MRSISSRNFILCFKVYRQFNININKNLICELLKFDFIVSHKTSNYPEGIEKFRFQSLKKEFLNF